VPVASADLGGRGQRVLEAGAPPGLLDSIVGGVASFFFGA
jgi:hypothetical protein